MGSIMPGGGPLVVAVRRGDPPPPPPLVLILFFMQFIVMLCSMIYLCDYELKIECIIQAIILDLVAI